MASAAMRGRCTTRRDRAVMGSTGATIYSLEGASDCQRAMDVIPVGPLEPEQLSLAQARRDGHDEQGLEPVAANGREELPPGRHPRLLPHWGCDEHKACHREKVCRRSRTAEARAEPSAGQSRSPHGISTEALPRRSSGGVSTAPLQSPCWSGQSIAMAAGHQPTSSRRRAASRGAWPPPSLLKYTKQARPASAHVRRRRPQVRSATSE